MSVPVIGGAPVPASVLTDVELEGHRVDTTDVHGISDTSLLVSSGVKAASGTDVLRTRVTGDTQDRFVINAGGNLEWGPGNGALDVNLYRSGANTLATDDWFNSASNVTAMASVAAVWGGAAQTTIGAVGPGATAGLLLGSGADTNLYRSAANTLKTDDSFEAPKGTFTTPGAAAVVVRSGASGSAAVFEIGRTSSEFEFYIGASANQIATGSAAGDAAAAHSVSARRFYIGVGTPTEIIVDNDKLGFLNTTPVARPSAYTQTYATASRIHAARAAAAVATTAATNVTPWGYSTQAQADAIRAELNDVIIDQQNTAQVLNQLLDDLQAYGLLA